MKGLLYDLNNTCIKNDDPFEKALLLNVCITYFTYRIQKISQTVIADMESREAVCEPSMLTC